MPFTDDSIPSDAELRIAQAQLVGWLEGLFHGLQAALVAQQMAASTAVGADAPGRAAAGHTRRRTGPGSHGTSTGTGQYL